MKILFIAFPNSIHTARWISQLMETDWDIHLFSSNESLRTHTILKNLICKSKIKYHRLNAWNLIIGQLCKYKIFPYKYYHGRYNELIEVIVKIQPDIIHSFELQHAGYMTLEVKKRMNEPFPTWIATVWGGDIDYFRKFEDHRKRIVDLLANCNYYSCECFRDVELAIKYGFKGVVLPVFPVTGGFDLNSIKALSYNGKTSDRKLIMLKGYHGWAGRALIGLKALENCHELLRDYTIITYLTDKIVKKEVRKVIKRTRLNIKVIREKTHEGILRRHGQARISIGLSITDGISISFLEAFVMGSFPIQSWTSCANEWITDGETGFLVPPDDLPAITKALRTALENNNLVDQASEKNALIAKQRLDKKSLADKTISLYKAISKNKHSG